MPIEIRELVIRAEVDPGHRSQRPAQEGAMGEEAIQEIVDKVVAIIKAQNER